MEIPDLLETMRQEARQDHQTLVKKVDDGFAAAAQRLNDHEKNDLKVQAEFTRQLEPVLAMTRNGKWLVATVVAAFVAVGAAGAWDYVVNHLHLKPEVTHDSR